MSCLRLFACLSVLLGSFVARADIVDDILSKTEDKSVCIDYSFVCKASNGKSARGNGCLVYQAGMIKITNEPFAVYDNGILRLTMNKSTREAVKEPSSFTGRPLDSYSALRLFGFNPKGAKISDAVSKDGSINGISVLLKDGTQVSVTFKSVKYAPLLEDAYFCFDTSVLGKGWTLSDLR